MPPGGRGQRKSVRVRLLLAGEGFKLAPMIKLEISKIPSQGLELTAEIDARTWPVLKDLDAAGEYAFRRPLKFDLHIYPERDLIVVKGRLETQAALSCGRCLDTFETPLRSRFTLRYGREFTQDLHGDDPGEIELTADQIGVTYHQADEIVLDDALQEQVVLALPFRPLCREDCKGLCQGCGADLNREPCGCGDRDRETPFAVLKNMQLPDKE